MSIEERLARDIAAVRGGIVVTDSDLWEARAELTERINGKRSRGRFGVAAAAAAAVLLAAGSVVAFRALDDDDRASLPANPPPAVVDPDADHLTGSAPTRQLIQGVWRLDNGRLVVQFDADGTVRFDEQGTLFSHPTTTGTYVIKGDLITVTTTDDVQRTCIGTTSAMRASLPKAGDMRFVPETRIGVCSPMPVTVRGAFEQVLPPSQGMKELIFSKDPDWKPLSDKTLLYGLWTAEGGGHVLEMDADGTYYVVDASAKAVDRGAWSFSESTLTLTSSAASTTCRAGDTLVLGAVQHENPGTDAVRGTVQRNTCAAAWTPAAWILIPNARD